MRYLLLSSLALGACATAPLAPAPASELPAPASEPSALARLLMAAGGAEAATLASAEAALGAPDIARQDGAGAALTYRLESCALLLVFVADAANELRLAEAHASARQPGAPAPSLGQCAAEIEARAKD